MATEATSQPASPRPDPDELRRMVAHGALDLLPALLAPLFGVIAALVIIVLILEWQGADPQTAWDYLYSGTLETAEKRADLVAYWMPLVVISFGLVLTFSAGLWNIGVEGQVVMGAIGATFAIRQFTTPTNNPLNDQNVIRLSGVFLICGVLLWNGLALVAARDSWRKRITGVVLLLVFTWLGLMFLEVLLRKLGVNVTLLSFVCAALAGALWASVAAVLKTRGGVNEIFGGVALNFIAQTFNMYLVSNGGPWQPVGSRATETARFPRDVWLKSFEDYRRLSPIPIYIAIGVFIFVLLIMYVSRWGLQLRAMGKNERSAFLLGVHTERNMILAMALCGGMAGLGGAFRVHALDKLKLTASPSGGIGFLAILVVLLASSSIILVPFVSFVFAVLSKGGQRIETGFQWDHGIEMDRSLVRVLQSLIVLMVVLAFGVRNRFFPPHSMQPVDEDEEVART
jgi:general nucleoside transport system permease protein